MTALDRPCQVLAMGDIVEGATVEKGSRYQRPDGHHPGGTVREASAAAGDDVSPPPSEPSLPFEQTTHVTLTITTDSATHQPGLYLRYRDSFPNAEAAARYAARVEDWLAARPDPRDEQPAPMLVDRPKNLREILRFHEDDAKFARPVVERRPFDWARE